MILRRCFFDGPMDHGKPMTIRGIQVPKSSDFNSCSSFSRSGSERESSCSGWQFPTETVFLLFYVSVGRSLPRNHSYSETAMLAVDKCHPSASGLRPDSWKLPSSHPRLTTLLGTVSFNSLVGAPVAQRRAEAAFLLNHFILTASSDDHIRSGIAHTRDNVSLLQFLL